MLREMLSVGLLSMLLSPVAMAACPAPYTTDSLLEDLMSVEDFLRGGDDAAAGKAAEKLGAGVPCLEEVLPSMVVGRVYRAVGGGLFAAGKVDQGKPWLRTAAEMEQSFDYGLEDIRIDHPLRDAWNTAKDESSGEAVRVEGLEFVEGKHWLDGRKLSTPKARMDRPHLYQNDVGGSISTWLITGNAFPSDALTAPAVAVVPVPTGKQPKVKKPKAPKQAKAPTQAKAPKDGKAPKEPKLAKAPKEPKVKKPKTTATSNGFVGRKRPWEKTPLMLGGGLVMLGSGGVYLASVASRKKFDASSTKADIDKFKAPTNQLVLASVGVLVAGAGTFSWGIILDGGPPLPGLNIRF